MIIRTLGALALAALVAGCSHTDNATMQLLPIGSACTESSQCGTSSDFFCDKDHPNGYCKRDCKQDSDCPSEAICAFDGAVGECHRECDTINDCRAGVSKAQAPDATEVTANIGQTRSSPLNVINARMALHKSMIVCVVIISTRRSTTSATTPPMSEHMMIGPARKAPTMPRASAEWVRRYTCQLIATN